MAIERMFAAFGRAERRMTARGRDRAAGGACSGTGHRAAPLAPARLPRPTRAWVR